MVATVNMVDMGRTTIQVPEELADDLHDRKNRGESYADVITRLIEKADSSEESGQERNDTVQREPKAEPEPEPVDSADAREILEQLNLPGSGKDYEQRVESVLAIYDTLRSNPGERMSKSDFRDVLKGTDVGYSGGFDSLWSNWVKSNPAQNHSGNVLEQLPGVELRGNDYIYRE